MADGTQIFDQTCKGVILSQAGVESSHGEQFLTWSSDFTVSTVNLKSKLKKMCTGYFLS